MGRRKWCASAGRERSLDFPFAFLDVGRTEFTSQAVEQFAFERQRISGEQLPLPHLELRFSSDDLPADEKSLAGETFLPSFRVLPRIPTDETAARSDSRDCRKSTLGGAVT